ncbi:unnamed protein product [Paramecium sonneborni]|uniref:HECT domain-containing protein n=1 Tax=Paramecium sonneborni TaxID=65129 RepID=A0A8S1QFJ8_9CILI|nr:unnamed protein product [Paramecium sonneborni]
MEFLESKNEFFKPKLIQEMKRKKIKQQRSSPNWEVIEQVINNIQQKTSTIHTIKTLNNDLLKALTFQDLCGSDIAYHLIINNQEELLIEILVQVEQIFTSDFNQVIQSVLKGILLIKKEINHKKLLVFIKQLTQLLNPRRETEKAQTFQFNFDIVISSRFNYLKNFWDLKLLLNIYKLLGNFQVEIAKLKNLKKDLFIKYIINSHHQEQIQFNHLKIEKYFQTDSYNYIKLIHLKHWDLLFKLNPSSFFVPLQDGFSIYMRLLKSAPFDYLLDFHQINKQLISDNLNTQHKGNYNILHCISENYNSFNEQFLSHLQQLNLDHLKTQAYFDQIPVVLYLKKQKSINQNFLNYLLAGVQDQNNQQYEGLQLLIQIYARIIFQQQKDKTKFLEKRIVKKSRNKKIKYNYRLKNYKKIKSKYKLSKKQSNENVQFKTQLNQFSNDIKTCAQNIYENMAAVHKILNLKGINLDFHITQYSFSLCHFDYNIFKLDQPLILFNNDSKLLDQFLVYLNNDFCSNIDQQIVQAIETLLKDQKLTISIDDLIVQRKIIILNALLQQNRTEEESQKIKSQIMNLLENNQNRFKKPFCSFSNYKVFQDYLICNNLITFEAYQVEDAYDSVINLLKLKHENEINILGLAQQVQRVEQYPSLHNLLQICFQQKKLNKLNIYYKWESQEDFLDDFFRQSSLKNSLIRTPQGIELLFQTINRRLHIYLLKSILYNFQEECIVKFFQLFYKIESKNTYKKEKRHFNLIVCQVTQQQLGLLFYYQLQGIRVQFNLRQKKKLNLKATTIQEEVILQQIYENKNFLQVLVSNDKYSEFLQVSLKFYPLFQKGDNLDYVLEALNQEAYKNLAILEQWIFERFANCQNYNKYKQTMFIFLRNYSFLIYGVFGKEAMNIDRVKFNRQIQNYCGIFERQIKLQQSLNHPTFFNFDAHKKFARFFIIYMNEENTHKFNEFLKLFFNSYKSSFMIKYIRNCEKAFIPELLSFHNKKKFFDILAHWDLITKDESEIKLIIERFRNLQNDEEDCFGIYVYQYIVNYYLINFDDIKFIEPYFKKTQFQNYQMEKLFLKLLKTNQIRKIEFILLNSNIKQKRYSKRLIDQNENYLRALRLHWSLALTTNQFKDLVQNNVIQDEVKEQVLEMLTNSGHFEKLEIVSDWIVNNDKLIELTSIACSLLIKEYIWQNKKFISLSIPTFTYQKTQMNNTLSKESNSSIETPYLFTNRMKTAKVLYNLLDQRDIDLRNYDQNYILFQILFPNTKWTFDDQNCSLVTKFLKTMKLNLLKDNWKCYMEIIVKNAKFYFEVEYDFLTVRHSKYTESWNYQKNLIDMLVPIYQNISKDSPTTIYLKQIQSMFNQTSKQKIKLYNFSKELQNVFEDIQLDFQNINQRQANIYYGLPFEIATFNELDLFLALMGRQQYSIIKILNNPNIHIATLVNKFHIIQYLIKHGYENTVIEVLKLLSSDEINESQFFHNGLPLLTYIVFKKWYKLYQFASQHLNNQWTLKPKILESTFNGQTKELTIHQFALLNQFYVYNELPIEKKFILRTSQFLIPNAHNIQLKAYRIYSILKILFNKMSLRKLEIISLQYLSLKDETSNSLEFLMKKFGKNLFIENLFLSIYDNTKNQKKELVLDLMNELGLSCSTSLEQFNQVQLEYLFKQIYNKQGHYHILMDQILRLAPNSFINNEILDSPNLALIVAQHGKFEALQNLVSIQDFGQNYTRLVSSHFIRIILMIKYGQNYDPLIDPNQIDNIHMKYYVNALDQIESGQQGSISIQFMNQLVPMLHVENSSIQYIDQFFVQLKSENNQIKKAFKIIIKLKELNYELEQIELKAIAKSDYLVKQFKFQFGDKFNLVQNGESSIIVIPFNYQEDELQEFLNILPCFFKEQYQNAILKKAFQKKGLYKKKKQIDIKFEENNLSTLYNDLRYLIPLLLEQKNPVDELDYKNQYQIKGWQQLSKKDHDENCFVYTQTVQFTQSWAQTIFNQEPQKSEYFKKYPNLILVFFNEKAIFNQVEIQAQLTHSLKQIIFLSTQSLDFKGKIELESFMQVFFFNKQIYSIFDNWYNLINSISNYQTLINTLQHILSFICQIKELYELESENQIIIKFQQSTNEGISPKNNYLDDYFYFCKPSIFFETNKLIINIPVSQNGQKVEVENYLDQIFNLNDLDQFVKEQFSLQDSLDALIYRYQLQKSAKEACEKFRKSNNFDIFIQFDQNELKQQIESLNYEQQSDYLSKFKTYFQYTLDLDLQNLITGNRFQQFYKESLCSGKYFQKPLDIGNFSQYNINSLKNSFGIVLNKEQFFENVSKKRIYHVFYTKKNRNYAVFCQYIKSSKNRNYFIQLDKQKLKKRYNRKANLQIKSEYIKGAIYYTYEYKTLIPQQNQKLILIDNEGHYYLNQDLNFASQIQEHTTLSDNIKVTRLCFNLSFQRQNIGQNILYFNQVDFRLKDYLETSAVESDKSYGLKRLKMDKSVIKIDPQLAEYDRHCEESTNKNKEQINRKQNRMFLTILSYASDKVETQLQYDIPNENTKLKEENQDLLTEYCKQYRKQQYQSRAGESRQDKIHFYDSLNDPIKDQKIINQIKCYIQHEKFDEIVHYPNITYDNGIILNWIPYIKGQYKIFVNGQKMNFKFAVIASKEVSYQKYKLIKDVQEFEYFVEQVIQFELFDNFNNLITKSDELPSTLSVKVVNLDVSVKQRSDYNDSSCQLFIQFCNFSKPNEKEDECKLEINLNDETIIQGKLVQIKPQPLTQKRIDKFASKFTYRSSIQFLIIRANFLNSLAQMDNHKGQKVIKINFLQEIANDQGGPSREFFCLLGKQLKDPENNLFKTTPNHGYYYLSDGILQVNESISYAIGMLIAYGIANKLKLGISFALPFWKIICELPIEFSDLSYVVEPQIYQSYLYLKNLSEDVLLQQEIYFVNQSDETQLCFDGKSKKVDCNNLDEYLLLSARYLIYQKYEKVYKQIKKGFLGQFDPKLLVQNFSLYEINQLIDIIDYQINKEKLLKCIHYSRRNQINENYFIQYISEADQEKLEHFLTFITGSKFQNMENFKIDIQTNLELQKTRLPVSRTCSNVLIIPQYPSYNEFKAKMDVALDWGLEFFGQG